MTFQQHRESLLASRAATADAMTLALEQIAALHAECDRLARIMDADHAKKIAA